jgi:metallo-beta-lactamase family protein
MQINFHGAAQTVTGSQHLLTINGRRLLLECGLYQGPRRETYERNLRFPFDPAGLEAVILSHAHIDHSGNLPNLLKQGYEGPIYATPATAHLSNIMLLDSAHIQESDAEYLNKKRRENGRKASGPPVEPLYTIEHASRVAQYFENCKYDQPFEPLPGVTARLVEAGHILGSAAVVLDIEEAGRKFRLWFSGDIGRRGLPLLRDPALPAETDYLIMEATYGDKPHRDPEAAYDELREVVRRTAERGGKIIVPAFAVGRTQELIYDLHRMMDRREIPEIPVIVDSPLAVNVSEVFRLHPECFDAETQTFVRSDKHRQALGFDKLTFTRSVEDSKALNFMRGPMVILSASGMAETGRILHHLKNNIEDPKNTVLIVSWQAPHTLGRRLADREERVKIFGEVYERRAEVATIGGLSAHGGQDMLMEYALAAGERLKEVYLVHAEPKPANTLRAKLNEAGIQKVYYPELHSEKKV